MKKALLLVLVTLLFLPSCKTEQEGVSNQDKIGSMFEKYKEDFPSVTNITVSDLMKLKKNSDIILVDVREDKEQKVSMIPGAMTQEEFEKDSEKYKTQSVVFYCTIGYRSGLAAEEWQKKEFQTLNLKGGILSWVHSGNSVESEEKETSKVHVYGSKWDLLPPTHEGIW